MRAQWLNILDAIIAIAFVNIFSLITTLCFLWSSNNTGTTAYWLCVAAKSERTYCCMNSLSLDRSTARILHETPTFASLGVRDCMWWQPFISPVNKGSIVVSVLQRSWSFEPWYKLSTSLYFYLLYTVLCMLDSGHLYFEFCQQMVNYFYSVWAVGLITASHVLIEASVDDLNNSDARYR